MNTHFFFIINSRIDSNKKNELLQAIQAHLTNYSLHFTEYAGHAVDLCKQAIQQKDQIIVSVGSRSSC